MANESEQVNPPNDQPQDESARAPEYREISKGELDKILEEHRKWLESDKYKKWKELSEEKKGNEAHFADGRADLRKANLKEANLKEADLKGATLRMPI